MCGWRGAYATGSTMLPPTCGPPWKILTINFNWRESPQGGSELYSTGGSRDARTRARACRVGLCARGLLESVLDKQTSLQGSQGPNDR